MINVKILKNRIKKEITQAKTFKELDNIFKQYLGKRGKITQILTSLAKLKKEKRAKIGKEINLLKQFLEKKLTERAAKIKKRIEKEIEEREVLDITIPGKRIPLGHLHPLTQVQKKVEEIFQSMGFSVIEGPEIETERYNFDVLNIPADHPARDFWDTLWLKTTNRKEKQKLLLRTHTSPVQVRFMEKNSPPLRIIVPGRVFRHEATDASHEVNFYQVEGLMVDKNISAANFKAIIQEFFQRFFSTSARRRASYGGSAEASREGGGKPTKIRMRPSYFPFTEPSFEVDINCLNCQGKGCSACSQTGWLEMMGAGMVHPNVYKAAGLNPKDWQGFAFGLGLERLAMMKYKINDIRLFYGGDLRFLNQF